MLVTLNEFIARAVGFFDRAEAASQSTEQAKAEIAKLQESVSSAKTALAERDKTIADLTARLDLADAAAKEQSVKIVDLSAALETEKKRVDETLAGMGVDPKQIPGEKQGGQSNSILSQFEAITDPVQRALFFNKHRASIMSAPRK